MFFLKKKKSACIKMYREIILNSNNYSRGSINHPIFEFPENIVLKKFCVRSVEVPNFYFNHPNTETWGITAYDANGTEVVDSTCTAVTGPQNFTTATQLATRLTEVAATMTDAVKPTFSVDSSDPNFIRLSSPFAAGVASFKLNFTPSPGAPSNFFRRLFGYTGYVTYNASNGTFTQLVPLSNSYDAQAGSSVNLIGALKMAQDNYILLKSDAMSGATFTPNLTWQGSFSSASTLSKVATKSDSSPYGTYNFFTLNDSPVPETMFSYNGDILSKFDLYFTRPHDNEVIDFQGFNFSVTIGIITDDVS